MTREMYALEAQRFEFKAGSLKLMRVLLETDVPQRLKNEEDIPSFYGCDSWRNQGQIPWHVEEKRAMTPAEAIAWLGERAEVPGDSGA